MISGNHTSRSSPDRAAGTRTYGIHSPRPATRSPRTRARSALAYRGSSTRSCNSAAPTNHRATPNQSSASSRTPA
ncbi:hypothetical protein BM536_017250 [Streptomyces phaeoluteigriseus]|uniref:Uncharacterized protein n=1 Tax=Streptomyces phaeoluteigriseus TaxID=114686 RepID=A0A1V6MRX3_9ACTN|nr:hypothetical protein BM536_017250 [Streptomyces phaeoluteigriseus]